MVVFGLGKGLTYGEWVDGVGQMLIAQFLLHITAL